MISRCVDCDRPTVFWCENPTEVKDFICEDCSLDARWRDTPMMVKVALLRYRELVDQEKYDLQEAFQVLDAVGDYRICDIPEGY